VKGEGDVNGSLTGSDDVGNHRVSRFSAVSAGGIVAPYKASAGREFFSLPKMKKAKITSVCECQARLLAELDENRQVIAGWAKDIRREQTLNAPAHTIGGRHASFDVAWFCPFCVRNTLRSFDAGGLVWRDSSTETKTVTT
jgi:hypothetical protein